MKHVRPGSMEADARAQVLLAYHVITIAWEHFGIGPQNLNLEQQHEARQRALRQILIEDAVLHSQEAEGVHIERQAVTAALQAMRQRARTVSTGQGTSWTKLLEDNALDEQALDWILARQMLVDMVMEKATAGLVTVTELDAEHYYYLHHDEFFSQEKRRARHILITQNESFLENTREQARSRIAAIMEHLRRRPERFAEQALKYSECPSSLQGGSLGWVQQGDLFPELDRSLFQMEAGCWCEVESELGFHVLWCEEIRPAHTLALDKVMPDLLKQMSQRQSLQHQKRWLRNLMQPKPEPSLSGRPQVEGRYVHG
ncbi:MAG: nitrogen fixation protein NifM [Pseudomonadales bacterium]|nr:nitrogen fixation protein NifM [Pseudomonadales bacterium]